MKNHHIKQKVVFFSDNDLSHEWETIKHSKRRRIFLRYQMCVKDVRDDLNQSIYRHNPQYCQLINIYLLHHT